MVGTAERPASDIHLRGLVFGRTDWVQPSVTGAAEEKRTGVRLATAYQAETHLPGVIELKHCREVAIDHDTATS